MDIRIAKKQNIQGTIPVPGDKSISHRSIMFTAIAKGTSRIQGFLMGEDCLSTIDCFRKLGIQIDVLEKEVLVHGKGLYGLTPPQTPLNVGNSGTTLRLLSGILAGQKFQATLSGDASIQKRPMDRVAKPLGLMGAQFQSQNSKASSGIYAPVIIEGCCLHGISYTMPIASAQVKSAVLLAGLYAQGDTILTEPIKSRNHTEIMLKYMGANIQTMDNVIHCRPGTSLHSQNISVPSDISSAAYFLVAASILPNSEVTLCNIGLNPSRTGILDVLIAMGGNIKISNERESCGEKVGDILVKSAKLKGVIIGGKDIPRLIDEIPVLAVAACFAQGETLIKDAQELKVKESNRIKTVVSALKSFAANIKETEDGMVIIGGSPLSGCTIDSHGDHRIAMSMAIAALCAEGETCICGSECANISFPSFYELLKQ